MRGSEASAHQFQRVYPPAPAAVAQVRRRVRRWLTDTATTAPEDLRENVELLLSEVMTNAVVHAGTAVEVSCAMTPEGSGVHVEVRDRSPRLPTMRSYGSHAGTGRGLRLLQSLAEDWGAEPTETGKCVWFNVGPNADHLTARHRPGAPQEPRRAVTSGQAAQDGAAVGAGVSATVQLTDVPLVLYRAWVQHAEALLREYLLLSLEVDAPEEAIAQHSQASDAIAALDEHIPVLDIGEDAHLALAAVEPAVTAEQVRVPIADEEATHFATLNRTLDAALRLADQQLLLNPPTQPELVALRLWLCGEVDRQRHGAAPVPWRPPEDPQLQARTNVPSEELQAVRSATTALLAADAAGTIVAASARASALLGYQSSSELEGSRLVSIVPARYRQAHLAGFTLHQLNGRAPLIGTAVAVPVLRRDGTEAQVLLEVTVHRQFQDEPVFIAAMAAEPASTAPGSSASGVR